MATRGPEDFDARFEEIMSHWDAEADLSDRVVRARDGAGETRERDASATQPATPPAPEPAGSEPPPAPRRPAEPYVVYRDPANGLSMGTDHRSWSPPDDPDDETYVPPPPAPMPSWERDPVWWAILVGLVGGPLTLLVLTLTGRTSPHLYLWLAGIATVAAFVGLVLRLPSSHDDDDDGARV
ncbi:hypothetical protein [Arsenicicoccus sp. oral taxon 190]|uniref:hypothetical protein n=1 Tax=Arsenicicoccus sp. oral taxon 190 TaxID=1658671 RepID=UPI00067DAD1E|nr:hypothetical protein [Arsenicicoccus sp. oral taxon 190]